jgi:hypothetical protein
VGLCGEAYHILGAAAWRKLMPQFMEEALAKSADKKGKTGREKARYVYGAMNNLGAMHGNKETAKGKRMEAKHEAKMRGGKRG